MLLIPIKYIEEGKNELKLVVHPYEIDLTKEFAHDIKINGIIEKFGWQLNIKAELVTDLNLVCDYTLEEFTENLKLNINIICKLDNLSQDIFYCEQRLQELDTLGAFKSDDEIGWFFKEVKNMSDKLRQYILN